MRFSNPWIDPRILQLRPDVVRTYLESNGWEYLGPGALPDLLMFDTVQPRGDKPNVLLPTRLDHSYQVQRLIELVTELALHEDRFAGDVLDDLLDEPGEASQLNGLPGSQLSRPADVSR